jgi:hypothetical protein
MPDDGHERIAPAIESLFLRQPALSGFSVRGPADPEAEAVPRGRTFARVVH